MTPVTAMQHTGRSNHARSLVRGWSGRSRDVVEVHEGSIFPSPVKPSRPEPPQDIGAKPCIVPRRGTETDLSCASPELREQFARLRDGVAARLTPAQLATAQRLAREWRPRTSTAEPPVHEQRPSTSAAPVPRAPGAGPDSTRDRIANLQRALRRLGYDPGPTDGIPGARTRAAIRAFQADSGLPVTGQVSERLESAVLAAVIAAG